MPVQLAKEYLHGMNGSSSDTTPFKDPPIGWIMSEKFDGYRALFRYNDQGHGEFISRSGKSFNAPPWFLESMPSQNILKDMILDGELWAGRDNFQLMGTVRKKIPIDEEWIQIQYQVYDITTLSTTFLQRLTCLKKLISNCDVRWNLLKKSLGYPYHTLDSPLIYANQTKIKSMNHMKSFYESVIQSGGEGIMLKHPLQPYQHGRSPNLLKYKPVYDREAIIIDHKLGNGKYTGMLGAFICKPLLNKDTHSTIDHDESHIFTLSGMDDDIRTHYLDSHPVGTIITYECSGYTNKGVPRFGRYVRKRDDIIIKDDDQSSHNLNQIKIIFNALELHCRENRDTFRLKSYVRANYCLRQLTSDSQLTDKTLSDMDGIGGGTMDKIRLIMETGTCPAYEKLKHTIEDQEPIQELMTVHGIGPVQAKKLVKAGFKSINDLRSCENIQDHLNDVQRLGLAYHDDIQQRIPYAEIQQHESFLKHILSQIDPHGELTIAGSYRRQQSDSGDIDILIKGKTKKTYTSFIQQLISHGYLIGTLANGPKKYMGISRLGDGYIHRRVDIMYTKPDEYPFAIFYFTGSSDFNQRVRKEILDRGMTINEYSLKDNQTKKKVNHKFMKEQDIFEYLGYEYVEPEDRIG